MKAGDVIKVFPDTNVYAYIQLIHSKGFRCKRRNNKLIVLEGSRSVIDKQATARSITQIRRENNLKRAELAEKIGVTSDTVWDWEVGKTIPRATNQDKLKELGWSGLVYKEEKNGD